MPDIETWVFDTNVVVSALLSADGSPGRLLDMVLARELCLALDDRIEAEYRDVLSRPKFGILKHRTEAFLSVLQFQVAVTALPWPYDPSPDPDDTMFLEAAFHTAERVLVTGNLRHFPPRCRGPVHVLTPQEAWKRFSSE